MIFQRNSLQNSGSMFMKARKQTDMPKLDDLKSRLRPGQVYRRADLARWTTAVDRHLRQLVESGDLVKLSGGLYGTPRKTRFGDAPTEPAKLVASFLKDDRFLMVSPNAYNALGVGMTQLYNEMVVYNHKRHGRFVLDGRLFDFRMKPSFPRAVSREFLLVDLVNNIGRLGENEDDLLRRVEARAKEMDLRSLRKAVRDYGGVRARRLLAPLFESPDQREAA
jgi:hypothetical protein